MIGFVRGIAGKLEALRVPAVMPSFDRALGIELWIPPTVMPPSIFRTGKLLARAVAALRPGSVLDLGTGSGIVSLYAARHGTPVVVASDLNPAAVSAARVNAMLNGVHVDARCGDLFSAIGAEERFSVIAFNPPFFERPVDHPLALALADRPGLPVLARFLKEARSFLAPDGCLLVAGSTAGALGLMRKLYEEHGYSMETVRKQERISERLVIDRLTC